MQQYKMTLDLNVLNHLGLTLYSNVAAVLSEVVANAWDADASRVDIFIDARARTIEIVDDGCGMSVQDANDRFLTVGYDKRANETPRTARGRYPMGRKGIGKLSLFSIADRVVVHTSKEGKPHGFILSVPAIRASIRAKHDYHPEPVSGTTIAPIEHGTRLLLSDLHRRATAVTVSSLRKRLARRFIFADDEFVVNLNGDPIGIQDRDDLRRLQFLWELSDEQVIRGEAVAGVVRRSIVPHSVTMDNRAYPVTGWIGSVSMPKHLGADDGSNLNSIVVLARGRLIQENILDKLNVGGIYTKYLTGQIQADFLDLDEQDDIATSDRQRIVEDDPRYVALLGYVSCPIEDRETVVGMAQRAGDGGRTGTVPKASAVDRQFAGRVPGQRQARHRHDRVP